MKMVMFLAVFFGAVVGSANPMVGAISAGMGGTGRAGIQNNESLYLNPATIALLGKTYAGGSYLSGYQNRNVTRSTYSVVLTDAGDDLIFPGSLGYRRHNIGSPTANYVENDFKVGLARRLHDRLSIGFGFNHLIGEHEESGTRITQNNADVGLLIGLQPNWGLSVTGENLIKASNNVPEELRRASQVAIGTQVVIHHFVTGRYELLMPLYTNTNAHLGHRAGVGISLEGYMSLSGGYSIDDYLGQNWMSVGLGWLGPRLKVAYSYQNEQRQKLGDRHLVDLWFDI